MNRSLAALQVLLNVGPLAVAQLPDDRAALAHDDECSSDGAAGCSLSALQMRGDAADSSSGYGFCSSLGCDVAYSSHRACQCNAECARYGNCCSDYVTTCSKGSGEHSQGASSLSCPDDNCPCAIHEEKIADAWRTCATRVNSKCHSCGLWGALHTPGKHGGGCHGVGYVGEKVVPTAPLGGVEGITASTASSFDNVFSCAVQKEHYSADFTHTVNPWKARTQHHLHVLVKPLDSRGKNVQNMLEKITQCTVDNEWKRAHVHLCKYSWARLYHSMPGVFSDVNELASQGGLGALVSNPEGEPTLATVGITVLLICDGKPVVLAHGDGNGGCSIEHQIA
eukprot:TRINITY_DN42335_c0_g1_i1.p1 TRINITY_DN42335_c0_g1~~TRINITY_DN42335_c0_g1_i1.p1  ORF type:complete len:338 (-),score=50.06 TRINITY_DN42335_c0_g1_i1:45-1058(-)